METADYAWSHLADYTTIPDVIRSYGSLRHEYKMVLMVAISSVIVFTCLSNLLTIYVIKTDKYLTSVRYVYLASLAVADLLVAVVAMTFMMIYSLETDRKWKFGATFCQIWTFLDYVSCTTSLMHVCLIARDCHLTVTQPLRARSVRTKRRALYHVLLAWLFPIVIWASILVVLSNANEQSMTNSSCELLWDPWYMILPAMITSTYTPIAVILAFFISTMCGLRFHMRSMSLGITKSESISNYEALTRDLQAANQRSYHVVEDQLHVSNLPVLNQTDPERTVVRPVHSLGVADVLHNGTGCLPETAIEIVDSEEITVIENQRRCPGFSSYNIVSVINKMKCAQSPDRTSTLQSNTDDTLDGERRKLALRWRWYASDLRAERQRSMTRSRGKQQQSAVRTLMIIMGFLLVCWLPFSVVWPIKALSPELLDPRLYDLVVWFSYLNSSINPIIYCGFNATFRNAYGRLLCKHREPS